MPMKALIIPLIVGLFLFSIILTGNANALPVLWSDNFNGNTSQQTWNNLDFGENSTFSFINDRYELHTESGSNTAIISYVATSANYTLLQARVGKINPSDKFLAYLIGRANPVSGNAYVLGISSGDDSIGNTPHLWLGKITGFSLSVFGSLDASIDLGNSTNMSDATIKFEISGDNLRGKIWNTSSTEPDNWNVNFTEGNYTSGYGGIILATYIEPSINATWTKVQAFFDDISLQTATFINSCQNLSVAGEYYELQSDINATSNCLIISNENVTLDLSGYNIGFTSGSGFIVSINADNATIMNGTMSNLSIGILFVNGSNSIIHDIEMTNCMTKDGGCAGIAIPQVTPQPTYNINNITISNLKVTNLNYGIFVSKRLLMNGLSIDNYESVNTTNSIFISITALFPYTNLKLTNSIFRDSYSPTTSIYGAQLSFVRNLSMDNVTITNLNGYFSYGLNFNSVNNSILNNINVFNASGYGYIIGSASNNNTIINSNFIDNNRDVYISQRLPCIFPTFTNVTLTDGFGIATFSNAPYTFQNNYNYNNLIFLCNASNSIIRNFAINGDGNNIPLNIFASDNLDIENVSINNFYSAGGFIGNNSYVKNLTISNIGNYKQPVNLDLRLQAFNFAGRNNLFDDIEIRNVNIFNPLGNSTENFATGLSYGSSFTAGNASNLNNTIKNSIVVCGSMCYAMVAYGNKNGDTLNIYNSQIDGSFSGMVSDVSTNNYVLVNIYNSTINSDRGNRGIYSINSTFGATRGNATINLYNTTLTGGYDIDNVANNSINVLWNLNVNNPMSAQVIIQNSTGNTVSSFSDSRSVWLNQYYVYDGNTLVNSTPHSITATKNGYPSRTTQINMNNNQNFDVKLSVIDTSSITGNLIITLGFGIMGIMAVLSLLGFTYITSDGKPDIDTFIKLFIAIVIIILVIVGVWTGIVNPP